MDKSALWWTFPPRFMNSFVGLFTWPTASMLNMEVAPGILAVCKHVVIILAVSNTVRPNSAHTTFATVSYL